MTGHIYKKKRPPDEEAERVIMAEGASVTSESEQGSESAEGSRRAANIRRHLTKFIHSNKFQIIIVSLVIVNCLVVIVELLLDLQLFENGRFNYTAEKSSQSGMRNPVGGSGGGRAMSDSDRIMSDILYYINLGILAIFVMEMAFKVFVLGPVTFMSHKMEVLDAVVVLVAFSLGLAFTGHTRTVHSISLIIVIRLWRITKILNSMVESVRHEAERKMGKERRARRALEREVSKLREYCLQQECELQVMRYMLRQNGIQEPSVLRPPVAVRTLSVIAEVAKEQEISSSGNSSSSSTTTTNSSNNGGSVSAGSGGSVSSLSPTTNNSATINIIPPTTTPTFNNSNNSNNNQNSFSTTAHTTPPASSFSAPTTIESNNGIGIGGSHNNRQTNPSAPLLSSYDSSASVDSSVQNICSSTTTTTISTIPAPRPGTPPQSESQHSPLLPPSTAI